MSVGEKPSGAQAAKLIGWVGSSVTGMACIPLATLVGPDDLVRETEVRGVAVPVLSRVTFVRVLISPPHLRSDRMIRIRSRYDCQAMLEKYRYRSSSPFNGYANVEQTGISEDSSSIAIIAYTGSLM